MSRLRLRGAIAAHSVALFSVALWLVLQPAQAAKEAIASAHPIATRAGLDILARGGNAFDAAIVVAATLAVVEPYSSGLGGGGFFLLHRASDGFEIMIDAREIAPGRASRTMYLDAEGRPQPRRSLEGGLAAGIPGTPAALARLAQDYGRLPLKAVLAPAIEAANNGFPVDARYVQAASLRVSALQQDANTAATFLDGGKPPAVGYVIRQPALAATLARLAAEGHDGFYRGSVAERLVEGVRAAGGIWELDDLAHYRVVERAPQKLRYRGARITASSLPSSGGVVLAEALQILDRFPLAMLPRPQRDHLIVEALRRGYQDRARYLGDPDFVAAPAQLTTRAYADERAASIDPARATPSAELDRLYPVLPEGTNTTHFSIVDAEGNRVAATLSVNLTFGAAVLAGDTGVLLNNEMDDFSIAPNTPNAYRLVGDRANAVEANKRPLSSMTPLFVEDERGVLVLGTPGGSRIISMVLLAVLEYVDGPQPDVERVVGAPRFHHQYLPDRVEYEPGGGFDREWVDALRAIGHDMQEGRRRWGNMQAVFVERISREASAYSDPRGKSGVLF